MRTDLCCRVWPSSRYLSNNRSAEARTPNSREKLAELSGETTNRKSVSLESYSSACDSLSLSSVKHGELLPAGHVEQWGCRLNRFEWTVNGVAFRHVYAEIAPYSKRGAALAGLCGYEVKRVKRKFCASHLCAGRSLPKACDSGCDDLTCACLL